MKIVIIEPLGITPEKLAEATAAVKARGHEIVAYDTKEEDQDKLAERGKDADIIIIANQPFRKNVIEKCKNLKLLSVAFTGVDHIDVDFCKEKGICVCNAAGYSTNAVAQHTFALILEHYSKVREYAKFVADGQWKRSKTFSPFVYPLNELAGKTIGIVGFGSIGSAVAKIAQAFEMKVLAYNRSEKQADGVEFVSFDELLERSDIVTVHCPLNSDSDKMFGKEQFAKMKNNALFVNTARGGVMAENDLYDALQNDIIGGAAVDTLVVEPMEEDCILMQAKNCIITPHIAWAPVETRERLMNIVADNIGSFINGTPKNVVS